MGCCLFWVVVEIVGMDEINQEKGKKEPRTAPYRTLRIKIELKGEPVKETGKWAEKDNQENEGSEKPRAMWLCRWKVGEARHESESPLALLTFPASTGSISLDREEPCSFKVAYEWARTS